MTITVRHRSALLLPTLAFCQFLVAVDYNIVLVALPSMGSALGLPGSMLQWIVSVYALAFGGLLLLGGRLTDLFSPRRVLLLALGLYGAGSLLAAVAPDIVAVLIGRAVQGAGGALASPAVLASIAVSFSEGRDRFRALSIWSAAGAIGLAGGSALGGVLLAVADWRSVFAVNLPLVLVAVVGTMAALDRGRKSAPRGRLDAVGAVTATFGITAIVFALAEGPVIGWTAPTVIGAGLLGAFLLVAFVLWERRASAPLLPLSLFRHRSLSMGLIVMVLFIGSIGTSYYTFSVFLQDVLGTDPLLTGLAFLPWGGMAIVGSSMARRLLGAVSLQRALVVSLAIAALGTAGFASSLVPGVPLAIPVLWTLVLGVGQAMGFASLYAAAGTGVEPTRQGIASAMMSTAQQIGTALGLAVLIGIATLVAGGDHSNEAASEGLRAASWVGAAVLLSAAAISLIAFGTRGQASVREGDEEEQFAS